MLKKQDVLDFVDFLITLKMLLSSSIQHYYYIIGSDNNITYLFKNLEFDPAAGKSSVTQISSRCTLCALLIEKVIFTSVLIKCGNYITFMSN